MGNPTIEEITRKLHDLYGEAEPAPSVTFNGPITIRYGHSKGALLWLLTILSLLLATFAFIFFLLGFAGIASAATTDDGTIRKPTVPPVTPYRLHASQRDPWHCAANFVKSLISRARRTKSRFFSLHPTYADHVSGHTGCFSTAC